MPFDFNNVLKRTGEGVCKQQASAALGIPIVGFDPASLAVSAGIVVGSWGISKILGSLFGDDTPPPIQTIDVQLAEEYPVPYRLGYHRYTGQVLYASATDNPDLVSWPTELDDRIRNTRSVGRGRTQTEDPNVLDLVYHLSAGKIHHSDDIASLGGIYLNNEYVELERLGGDADAGVDIYGAFERDRTSVLRDQNRFFPYAYVTVYRGYSGADGFSEVVMRSGGTWPANAVNANHSFAVVTLLDYTQQGLDPIPKPWTNQVPQVQFVGPGIELPDLSQYEASTPRNPYTVTRYTDNLASVMYWVLTAWPEGPQYSADQFDHRSIYAAYRRCAEIIDNQLPDGYAQTEGLFPKKSKRYTFNGTIRAGDRWDRVLADLDAGWMGSVYSQDGIWRFHAGGNTPQRNEETLVINAKDGISPVSYITQPRREERFNVSQITMPQSQPHNYNQAPPVTVKYGAGIAREGGEEIVREISIKGITDPGAANRIGTAFLRLRNVRTLTANFVGADPALRTLKPYEGVYFTDDKHNIENIPMIVERKVINQDGSTSLILKHDPADSFSDSQTLPSQTRIGERGPRGQPPTNVRAALDFVDVRGQRALRGRVTCVLDKGYNWIDVQWRKASETIGTAQMVSNDLRRNVRNPVVFIPSIEPNTDYLIAVRVGVGDRTPAQRWTEIAWNSGDDIRAMPNPTGLLATGIIGGAYIEFDDVDTDDEPYYKRTELKFFVGDEAVARTTAYSMGNDHFYGGLPTGEEHDLRIEARHESKSGVFSGPTTVTTTTLTAASAASGFLGLNAWGKRMVFNNFQSVATNINANGRWGLSRANTWANLSNLSASDTLRFYQSGTGGTDETTYLDQLEAGDYLTLYISELQNITVVLQSITKNNVGTPQAPRYRYDVNAVALSNTLRENPVPVLASNTEIAFRFSRAVAGVDGTDGAGVEYIFCSNNDTTLPTNQYPSNTWGYDRGGTINGKVWRDGAPDLTVADPVLFRSQRKIVGSPNTGDPVNDTWTTPVVVGRIGIDGTAARAGQDGRGVEYVFRVTNSATRPATPGNTRPYDQNNWNGDGWFDAAPSLSATNRFLWRSARLVPGLPAAGTARASTWGNWTNPVIVGRFGETGAQGLTGAQGEDGQDGQGAEFRFARTRTSASPARPPFSLRFDASHSTWFDAAPEINSTFQYRWQTQRRVPGTPSASDIPSLSAGWGQWTEPVIVGRWGAGTPGDKGDTGAPGPPGAAGNDGRGIEYIFAKYSSQTLPSSRYPQAGWGFDIGGTRGGTLWTDAAPNLDATNQFLFVSQRPITGTPSRGASIFTPWTTPRVVGRYGEDGAAGRDGSDGTPGADGIGIEYIFVRYPLETLPSGLRPLNSWSYDNPLSRTSGGQTLTWHDGAPDLNLGTRYLFRCERKVEPLGSTFVRVSGSDGNWSTPRIVGHFASKEGTARGSALQGLAYGIDYIYGLGNEDTRPSVSQLYGTSRGAIASGYWQGATQSEIEGSSAPPLPPNGQTDLAGQRIMRWYRSRPATTSSNPIVWTVQRYLVFIGGGRDALNLGASRYDNLGYFYWFFPSYADSRTLPVIIQNDSP